MEKKNKKTAFRDEKSKIPLVVVVDDEPNMCNALQRILEMEGYRVTVAQDGETALRFIRKEKPNVVLLDIMMPGMNGIEVSAKIKQICDSRIVFFTARADLAKKARYQESTGGVNAFITKPATSKRILSAVDTALGKL